MSHQKGLNGSTSQSPAELVAIKSNFIVGTLVKCKFGTQDSGLGPRPRYFPFLLVSVFPQLCLIFFSIFGSYFNHFGAFSFAIMCFNFSCGGGGC